MAKKNRKERKEKKKRVIIPFVERPFEGLSAETSLIAMREILPLATLPATTTKDHGSENIILATVLPNMVGALRRKDGVLLVAMQTVMNSGDVSLDVASRILAGLELKPGDAYTSGDQPDPEGPRLGDIIEEFGEMQLEEEPAFWLAEEDLNTPESQQALKETRESMVPCKEIETVTGAYWCRMSREFLRWVRPEPRDQVLDGLARLRAAGKEHWGEGSRFIGAFRSLGMSIPVWELARGTEADELDKPLKDFEPVLEAAIADTTPLTTEEKRARAGLVSRQVTLR